MVAQTGPKVVETERQTNSEKTIVERKVSRGKEFIYTLECHDHINETEVLVFMTQKQGSSLDLLSTIKTTLTKGENHLM